MDAPTTPTRTGCLIFAIVPVAVALTFLAYAVMLGLGLYGRPASGDRVTITFEACPEAGPILTDRAMSMGLTDAALHSEGARHELTATLPADPQIAASIPGTLAERGLLTVRASDGAVLADHTSVESAGVRMDIMMTPTTFVRLKRPAALSLRDHVRENPEGHLAIELDGAEVFVRSNRADLVEVELEIPPSAEDDQARMQLAAARGVVLGSGPHPCPVQVVGVRPAD